jgi:hypothetical protein
MAWDKTKPATSSSLVSADVRNNWTSLEAALGNPDTSPLTISAAPTYKPGAASTFAATVSGRIHSNTTIVGNITTGEDDLMTFSLPANTLNADLKAVRVVGYGITANNANAKTLRLYLGTSLLITVNLTVSSAAIWWVEATIIRTGASAARVRATRAHAAYIAPGGTDSTVSFASAQTIKFTGDATATDDVQQTLMLIEVLG